jgi:hypothetical protein
MCLVPGQGHTPPPPHPPAPTPRPHTPHRTAGWVAIGAFQGKRPGASAFSGTLLRVAENGGGQAFASALLLASGVCAMMSTADSAMLAFSTM